MAEIDTIVATDATDTTIDGPLDNTTTAPPAPVQDAGEDLTATATVAVATTPSVVPVSDNTVSVTTSSAA